MIKKNLISSLSLNKKINFFFQNIHIKKTNFIKNPLKNFTSIPSNLPNKDLYKILDIPQKTEIKDIKQAYYKKAKQYHPDKYTSN